MEKKKHRLEKIVELKKTQIGKEHRMEKEKHRLEKKHRIEKNRGAEKVSKQHCNKNRLGKKLPLLHF